MLVRASNINHLGAKPNKGGIPPNDSSRIRTEKAKIGDRVIIEEVLREYDFEE